MFYKDNLKLKKIGEGMVSEAFLYNKKFVLLTGKREDSFDNYKKLKDNLDLLNGKIETLKIPSNAEVIAPCSEYPFGAFSFVYVPGNELKKQIQTCTKKQKQNIGKKLAEFIHEMQNINISLDKSKEIEINNIKLNKSLLVIEPYLTAEENEKLKQVAVKYNEFMVASRFCVTHGDLQEENLIVDKNNNLTGIIDFGNMEYYVSEIEFAPMMEYDSVIFESMIKNYKGSIDINNIKLVGLVRGVRFFKHVLNWSKPAILKEVESIRSLLTNYNL